MVTPSAFTGRAIPAGRTFRMISLLLATGVFVAGLLAASAVQAASVLYRIDDSAGSLVIHVGKSGLLKVAGHEHEVIASRWSGELRLDSEHPENSTIHMSFPAAGLHVNEKKEPPDDAREVQEAMQGPRCLDAARFPTIVFQSARVAVVSQADGVLTLRITGELSLHGVKREISFPATVSLGESSLTAKGRVGVRQREFGIKPISAGAGTVKVKNEVSISFEISAKAAEG